MIKAVVIAFALGLGWILGGVFPVTETDEISNHVSVKKSTKTPVQMKTGTPMLAIDPRTGCHYLAVPGGGITPRLAADGEHICEGVQ